MKTVFQSQRALVLAGGTGGVLFAMNLLLGGSLSWIFRLSGLSGLVTGLTIAFAFTLAASLTRRFGTVTLAWTLYSLFAIPTVLMGPPNPIKVLIGFLAAFSYDLVLWISRYRSFGFYLGWIVFTISLIGLFFYFFVRGQSPEAEALSNKLKAIINGVFLIEGLAATAAARAYYRRISQTPLAKSYD